MAETLLHEVFGVSKSYRSTRTEVRQGGVFVAVEPLDKRYLCPKCRSRDVIRKGKRVRRVQTVPIGFHPVYLQVAVPRCQCNPCRHICELAPPPSKRRTFNLGCIGGVTMQEGSFGMFLSYGPYGHLAGSTPVPWPAHTTWAVRNKTPNDNSLLITFSSSLGAVVAPLMFDFPDQHADGDRG